MNDDGVVNVNVSLPFSAVVCPECGTIFQIMKGLQRQRWEDHKAIWCPNGHVSGNLEKTELETLREAHDAVLAERAEIIKELEALKQAKPRKRGKA